MLSRNPGSEYILLCSKTGSEREDDDDDDDMSGLAPKLRYSVYVLDLNIQIYNIIEWTYYWFCAKACTYFSSAAKIVAFHRSEGYQKMS